MNRFYQLAIVIDQLLNVLIGSGYADETLSAYAWRKKGWRLKLLDALLWFDKDHCYNSYLSELNRKQLPRDYHG